MWGKGILLGLWWPCDVHRHSRKQYILIDTHHWPKIGLTMDDREIEQVYQFLKAQIVPSEGQGSNEEEEEKKTNGDEFTSLDEMQRLIDLDATYNSDSQLQD
ncbi:unnamed protein product [Didymodactylos carnosus]|uniref:Uncharacterized protein n=1 Tax=Didymodactylos carnosus TaxID=1234261 RepID=A0A815TJ08_9BILA|nr:unnamed protein product [Didymodactylos carnosus]CAF1503670.1 unnamed protein product [Didymodactylos carnosus]CAF4071234.1 unnamed protein product [Didymodactylos carnosus]CAF4365072.1 unnamed protein product [Didymodactylos carnosus]